MCKCARPVVCLAIAAMLVGVLVGCARLPQSYSQTLGVYIQGTKMGTYQITNKQEPFEGKPAIKAYTEIDIEGTIMGTSVAVTQKITNRYARTGELFSEEQSIKQGNVSISTKATYKGDTASYSVTANGATKSGSAKLPAGAKFRTTAFEWGSKTPLKVGASTSGKMVSPGNGQLVDITEKVESTETVDFEGKKVKAYVVTMTGPQSIKKWLTKDHHLVKSVVDIAPGMSLEIKP